MPRSESFGAFVFLRDKLRLAFAVISVPLRRDWCRVLCAVCGGGRLSPNDCGISTNGVLNDGMLPSTDGMA